MAQSLTQKTVNTFIRGLITEAGELTFPEGASIDELNCELDRDGSRRRRLGVELEASNVLSTFTVDTGRLVSTGEWNNVGGQSGLEFLVVQTGPILRFYNKSTQPYSGNEITQTVDLTAYEVVGTVGAANAKCQFTSIDGALVVASPAINTIYIERDNITEALTTTQISFNVRDFEWLGDRSEYTRAGPKDPPYQRKYDTANAGWVGPKGQAALNTWLTGTTTSAIFGFSDLSTIFKFRLADETLGSAVVRGYPPLTHPWYSGKDSNGNFSAAEWEKVYSGSSLIGNGAFILNFFSKDRSLVSGIPDIPIETESSRFRTVATFAGRVFYAGLTGAKNTGTVLFSRIIDNLGELGDCYQINDPTAEDLSDILDNDGGVIRIPDAVNIRLLYSFNQFLFVFAENGVWSISGVDGVFKATEYSVRRISNVGILTAETFAQAEGIPFWWSKTGIHTLSIDQSLQQVQEQNISISTIQTFWDNISSTSKQAAFSAYDGINKKIYWFYPNNGETFPNKYNRALILDIPLQAFYPWAISDETTNTDYIVGASFYSGFGSDLTSLDVVLDNGDDVMQGVDDVVSVQYADFPTGIPAVVLLVRDGATGRLTMALFSGDNFLDWGTANYTSYAEAGYEFFGDLLLQKTAPYVITYMRTAEEGWSGSEGTGYDPIRGSSLLVSAYWDFKKTPSWTPQQAYRYKYPLVVNPSDLTDFAYPATVITTRMKLTGRGRSMRLRFESEQGKDFILLGYGVLGGRNQRF